MLNTQNRIPAHDVTGCMERGISAQHATKDEGIVIKWDTEAVCKTKMPKEVMAVAPGETDSDETFFLGTVTEPDCTVITQPDSDEDWRVILPVNALGSSLPLASMRAEVCLLGDSYKGAVC